VAIVDVGIASHPEITGKIVDSYDIFRNDRDASPEKGRYESHAVRTASVIAARHDADAAGPDTSGLAPDVQLLNVKVTGTEGSTEKVMAAGIRWAVDHGAQVIYMPLGSAADSYSAELYQAFKYAYDKKVVTVISGGNDTHVGATGAALAAEDGLAIAAGNLNVMNAMPFASSNLPGAVPFGWVMAASSGYLPDAGGGYSYFEDGGTSYAGPYVAGLAALLKQKYPDASAQFIMDQIIAGAARQSSDANATASNDMMRSSAGADVFDGQAGRDTVSYSGKRADFTVRHEGDTFLVTDRVHAITDTLSNVERITFTDSAVALDTDNNAGSLYRLYQAAFARTPDKGGLGYWLSIMDSGQDILSIAKGFLSTPEAQAVYGNLDPARFITQLYANVLERTPDEGGLAFHLANLQNGLTLAQTLVNFSDSAENIARLTGVMNDGVDYVPFA
jgi:subtilisin family serine protease